MKKDVLCQHFMGKQNPEEEKNFSARLVGKELISYVSAQQLLRTGSHCVCARM